MNPNKWNKMPFSAQMGNIGSEISRVIYWQEAKEKEKKESALWRALELIDLTITQKKSNELFRLREVVCDIFLGKNTYKTSVGSLKEYFLQFAAIVNK